ncbi:sugar MFS transporter [Campylobacter sp. RM9333]|uniref:sugar MFS transporter n=1 Tax=Campylobacter sp. RM9333 TaxID=2735731 RepID=UPI001D279283|nr:sugar MFS transporter [Campylobacter sp. RM9333]
MRTQNNSFSLVILTALFFMMGFLTVLNDILIPHLKELFELTYFQSSLVQFCFFGAYFITSAFFGKLIQKIGYQNGVVGGFLLAALGAILFYPAAGTHSYAIFLGALFVLASGVVLLQVTGNPFVTLLSPSGKEARNLALVQAFNSLGTTVGPFFGSLFILSSTANLSLEEKISSVQLPYLGIAVALIVLGIFVKFFIKLPDVRITAEEISENAHDTRTSAWQYKHLVLGAIGIFCYVGAEVAIGSFLILYLMPILNITQVEGASMIAYYWGGAMVGRFIGSYIMNYIKPAYCLAFNAVIAMTLLLCAILIGGELGAYAVLGVGFFNSIMFPTIFSLATNGLGRCTSQASGIICIAIVGGAIIPPIQGILADIVNLHISFIIPAICYLYILFFAVKGYKCK